MSRLYLGLGSNLAAWWLPAAAPEGSASPRGSATRDRSGSPRGGPGTATPTAGDSARPVAPGSAGRAGSRRDNLARGVRALRDGGLRIDRLSSVWETEPVGCPPGAPWFLNLVASAPLRDAPPPEEVLALALRVERRAGREHRERNASRVLDVDLLIYGDVISAGPHPVLPHPRLHTRRFVLAPLVEVAPDLVPPGLGRTVSELLARLPATAAVRNVGRLAVPLLPSHASCRPRERVL